jgi:uncharacterized protein YggE
MTEQLKDIFGELGFSRSDLKTTYFNVDTKYESYRDKDKAWKQRLVGYEFEHRMKIEFPSDNKRLGQILYALAHCRVAPEFSIEYTVADVEKCKNELLGKAISDSKEKAAVLTNAAGVALGDIINIDYSWAEVDIVSRPVGEMLMRCEAEQICDPEGYDIDIEADDIDVTDTVTVVWSIR